MNNISIHRGSILDCKVDAIVNPANSFLRHGGGLARIIDECARGNDHTAAIREDWPERDFATFTEKMSPAICEYNEFAPGLIPTGAAVLSPPGALCRRFKGIIHVVAPIWGGGRYFERSLLYSAFSSIFDVAEDVGFESVAIPAIGAGIFGCPIGAVAKAAASTAIFADLDVTFALLDERHVEAFSRVFHIPLTQVPEC